MDNSARFDKLIELLLEDAVKSYKNTGEYKQLKNRLDQMDMDCENMFTKAEHDFADECFWLLLEASSKQEEFIYHQGLLDGVALLKMLGVLG